MAKQFVDTADQAGKLAQQAGITTESFTSLAYAAEQTVDSAEPLKAGFRELNKNIVEAASGAGKALDQFNAIGVSVRDASGHLKTADQVLLEVADQFAATSDGASKTAAALALFGKSGASLIPMLNEGADAIRALQDESDAWGQTISGKTSKQADEFNDNMARLKSMFTGLVNVVVTEMLPTWVEYSNNLIQLIKENGLFEGTVNTLVDAFKVLDYAGRLVINTFKGLWEGIKLVGGFIGRAVAAWVSSIEALGKAAGSVSVAFQLLWKRDFSGAGALFKQVGEDLKNDGKGIVEQVNGIGDALSTDWDKIWKTLADGPTAPIFGQGVKIEAPEFIGPPMPPPSGDDTNRFVDSGKWFADQAKAARLMAEMFGEGLRGSRALMFQEEQRYADQLAKIEEISVYEDQYEAARQLAYEAHQKRLNEIHDQGLAARADLDQAYANGQVDHFMQLMQSADAHRMMELEAQQQFMSTYAQIAHDAHFSIWNFASTMAMSFRDNLAGAISGLVMGTKSLSDAFKEFGQAMLQTVVNFVAKWIASRLTMIAMEAVFGAALFAQIAAQAAIIGSAWAAPAALASLATLGGNAAPAKAAIAATIGFAQIAAVAGMAHDGIDSIPREGTWILDKGERVLSPRQNEDLTSFLAGTKGVGGGRAEPQHFHVYLDGRELFRFINDGSRDGQLEISSKAIIS